MSSATDGQEMLGKWVVGPLLGEGGFSQVRLGTHIKSGEQAALKILEKKSGNSANSTERKQVESEIDAMRNITHPNVIQMKDFNLDMTFRKKNIILVVLELASGGELFEYLSFTGAFEEPIARSYFHQLMEGLQAAHSVGICHRDLKPENLLMDDDFQLKIADFGFAHTMKSTGGDLYTECGTRGYMAPEMFRNKGSGYNGFLTDVWACGVVLFIMIAGFPPYQQPAATDWWFDKLCKKKYSRFWMAHCRTAYFSEEAKDLINKIFTVDPSARITVEDVMAHPWYQGEILTQSDLTKVLAERKNTVDAENNKLKVQQQQDQVAQGYGSGTCRAIGDEGSVEDAEVDELPDFAPPSIIVALQTGEDVKGDDMEGESGDVGVGFSGGGAFGGGAFAGGAADAPMGVAPTFNPVKMNFTKFDTNVSPEETYNELIAAFEELGFTVGEKDGYSVKVQVKDLSDEVNFVANVYANSEEKDVEEKTLAIVECQRRKGNSVKYRNFYAKVRNHMDAFVAKAEKVAEVEDEKVAPETTGETTTTTTTTSEIVAPATEE